MIGTVISHYKILEKFGAGGMGVVYKAEDTKLKRTVALKFLPPELTRDPEAKARFIHEAQAASILQHHNICTIHDIEETADCQLFIVMDFYDGVTLKNKIGEGLLTLEEALHIAIQIAEGLAKAHEKGIVHRDIKPANILITSDGIVKILDFGLAKLTGKSVLTKTGTTVGTVAYMSPEQAQGVKIDHRSDIWSLGVVLYEMITGQQPFHSEYELGLIYAIINENPELIHKVRPGTTPELSGIVCQALAKKVDHRYQSIKDFQEDLKAVAAGMQPIKVKRLSWRTIRRVRPVYSLSAVLFIILSLLIVLNSDRLQEWFLGRMSQVKPAIRLAVLPFVNLSGDSDQEFLSDGLTQELITQLGHLHPEGLSVIAQTSVMRYKKMAIPIEQIGRELGVNYLLEGSVRQEANRIRVAAELVKVSDQTQIWSDTYERDLSAILAVQEQVSQSVAKALAVKLLPAGQIASRTIDPNLYETYLKGMFYVSQNNPDSFEKGMRYLHQAVEINPAEPLGYIGLAQGYVTMAHGGADEIDYYQRARAAAEQALKLDPNAAEAVGALAEVALYYEWDWRKAEELFQHSLELNPSLAMTHYHYAWYLALFNRLDEAIAEHKLARDLDPLRALHTGWLGQLYNYAGRYDEAIIEAKKALELNPNFWPSYQVMRIAYFRKGMHGEAIAAAKSLVEINPLRGNPSLVAAYAAAGQREQALAIVPKMEEDKTTSTAVAYLVLGNKERALQVLESCYEAHRSTLPWVLVHGNEFESLRSDPRFQDLLRRMRLPLDENK
jgi:serine/threonine-protein kinase